MSGKTPYVRTEHDKLAEFVSVKDFGARGDGVTDDTAAFVRAGGKRVHVPAGPYVVDHLQLVSGTMLVGDGQASVIVPKNPADTFAVGADSGAAGSFVENIVVRDLTLRGAVATLGYSEWAYLMALNGVRNALVENVTFVGFRGDGLYLGSGLTAGQERHNHNVTVRGCTFDGVNAQNRNGVSVIDCDTLLIEGNRFVNTTKVGEPGCIDLEPNADAFAVIRNVTIRGNRMTGGNEAGIALLLRPQSTLTTPHENFLIEGNFIEKPKGFTFAGEVLSGNIPPDATVPYGVLFKRNTVRNSTSPFIVFGGVGVTLQDNTFYLSQQAAEFGYTVGNLNCALIGNTFALCGQSVATGVNGLLVRWGKGLTIERNRFVDCGRVDGVSGRAISFLNGCSGSYIALRYNEFSSPTALTTYAIGAAGYTFDNGTCEDTGNKYLFATNHDFLGKGSIVDAAPATGTWEVGNTVTRRDPSVDGLVGWICMVAGTPGTWSPIRLAPFPRTVIRNYQVVEDFAAATYDTFSLNVQSNAALTYNAPTGGTAGQKLTIRVKNGSGGAMGAITWNAAFHLAGAWVNPANANSRSITFFYDGAAWIELYRSAADVPN